MISIHDKKYPLVELTDEDYKNALLNGTSISKLIAKREREELVKMNESLEGGKLVNEQMDAFQRQLAARGISGKSKLSIFWNPMNIALFPELIERAVLDSENNFGPTEVRIEDIIGADMTANQGVVTVPKLELPAGNKEPKLIAEGSGIPVYMVTESTTPVTLSPYGFCIRITPEALATLSVDLVNIMVSELAGAEIRRQIGAALTCGIASGYKAVTASATFKMSDIVKMFMEKTLKSGYEPDILVSIGSGGTKIDVGKILDLTEVRDTMLMLATGNNMVTPTVRNVPLRFYNGTPDLSDKLVGFRKATAVHRYTWRAMQLQEITKLRLSEGGSSEYTWRASVGFNRFSADSVRILA